MRGKIYKPVLRIAFLLLLFGMPPAEAIDLDKKIKEIRISGNVRANSQTVRYYIHSKVGEPYSVKTVREDIRRIFDLRYFDDIVLETEEEKDGLILTFRLKEKPFVKSVKFEGSKEVPKQDMAIIIKLKKGTFFQKHILKKDIAKIKAKYQKKGYYFTDVETIIKDAGNNQVDVTYNIIEKQKVKIVNIKFLGNKHFTDYELRDSIETKELTFMSFLTDNGNFEREILKSDLLKLESKYRDDGYIKASVETPRIEVDRENSAIYIIINVHEGEQFHVGSITAKGDAIYTAKEILEKIELKVGDPFNQSLFRQGLFKVTELYSNRGYAYANPAPKVVENEEKKVVDIQISVEPGDKIYIGQIRITGNEKTNENVIRREFRIHEMELFNGDKMVRTRQRLANTGFFDNVDIEQKSGSQPDLMDLNVNVIERPTGNLQAGVGYSSTESVTAKISETNFFGTGKKISLGVENSDLRQDYYIDFTDPKLFDRDIRLGYQLYSRQYDYVGYTRFNKGGSVTAGRGLSEYSYANLKYKYEIAELNINASDTISQYLTDQTGENISSSIEPLYSYDTRDNYLTPKDGHRIQLSAEVAGGALGGVLDFYKVNLDAKKYFPLPGEFVFVTRGQIRYAGGYNGQALPIFENYYLGSSTTLRGFSYQDVGPKDDTGFALGGDSSLLFNLEVHYHFSKAVIGALFYDRGQVYGTYGDLSKTTDKRYDLENMREGVGIGMTFITPMIPITLSWGFKLDKYDDEPDMQFHFNMGGIDL
jgi:outer membrane protein insertion porin family